KLITNVLPEKGILFVTASGNKVDAEDLIAQQIYLSEFGVSLNADQLRDLAIHNFYPAHLSTEKNGVITVTTTNGKAVAPTQNYSNSFTDLGVIADKVTKDSMQFQVPFAGMTDFISGSSFATAIATGVIGAYCEKAFYVPGLKKKKFIDHLLSLGNITVQAVLEPKFIRKGAVTKKVV
ncbi:MAG: S8 family serine peptidase, partial [Flavisolibacter sp.]